MGTSRRSCGVLAWCWPRRSRVNGYKLGRMSDPATPAKPITAFENLLKKLVAVPKKELDEKVKAFKERKKRAKR